MALDHVYVVTTQAAHEKQVHSTFAFFFFFYLKLAEHYQKCLVLHLETGTVSSYSFRCSPSKFILKNQALVRKTPGGVTGISGGGGKR